ncbi:MAG: hypothetical protein AABX83_02345 [Nanoarchaeota archaeon]
MTVDRELIKLMIAGKMRARVYTLSDILSLFREIGLRISEAKLRKDLNGEAIDLSSLDVDPRISGYNPKIRFYTESATWGYLKEMENEGKVDLGALRIRNFDDLLLRENTNTNYAVNGRVIDKPLLPD